MGLQGIMGNTESVAVQKRLARFRPEERPVVEGVFDRLQAGAGLPPGKTPAGKNVTLEMLKVWLPINVTLEQLDTSKTCQWKYCIHHLYASEHTININKFGVKVQFYNILTSSSLHIISQHA